MIGRGRRGPDAADYLEPRDQRAARDARRRHADAQRRAIERPADGVGVLRVDDEGVGIAAEELDGIFQPFRGSFGKGTGLGLAIVHRIVTDYGGRIDVGLAPARHHIPRELSRPSPRPRRKAGIMIETETAAGHASGRGAEDRASQMPRILIVDDEQSMREWMRILFQRDGFEVLVAEDGIVARDIVAPRVRRRRAHRHPHAAPGRRRAAAERSRELRPTSIVLMMTAHLTRDSEEWRRRASCGAEALFEKPFRDVNLVTLQVRQLIDSRRVRHENDVLRQAIADQGFAGIIGRSAPMLDVFRLVETVCRTNSTVLITGESGTGKELVARADAHAVAAPRPAVRRASTAARCPKRCSSPSSSATCAARSPAPTPTRRA